MTIFDRSRHEDFEKCPRLRLISYEYPRADIEELDNSGRAVVHGVQRRAMAVPLLTGGVVHKGLEYYTATGDNNENEAVQYALNWYDHDIIKRGIEVEVTEKDSPASFWTIKVQRVLCEALIRGWTRYVWPELSQQYTVIAAEQEERMQCVAPDSSILTLLTRSDLILRRNEDGRHFVMNHKTINEVSDRKLQSLRYDTQSISEVLAAQSRYDLQAMDDQNCTSACIPDADNMPCGGRASGCTCECHKPTHIDGVIYDLLIKGPQKAQYPKDTGIWHNASPLAWVYVKEGQTGIEDDAYAARYDWHCTAPHKMTRGYCDGNAKHTIGPKYHRKLVTEVFPNVTAWLEWLEANEPELLREQFQTLPAIMRSEWDVEVWKRCVLTEEARIANDAEIARSEITAYGWARAQPLLDVMFPKHTAHGNCFWPGKCKAFDICWGNMPEDLYQIEGSDGELLYTAREMNHPEIPDAGAEVQDAGEI